MGKRKTKIVDGEIFERMGVGVEGSEKVWREHSRAIAPMSAKIETQQKQ